jgi:hypothetical protein
VSAKIIRFPTIRDDTGGLTAFEFHDLPFNPKRVFLLTDLVQGASRGGHAHHELEELIVAVSGSFTVRTLDEHGWHRWTLNRADQALHVPPSVWRVLGGFSGNSVAMVLASTEYNPLDYVRSMDDFLASLPEVQEDWFGKARWKEVEEWRKNGRTGSAE